MPIDPYTSFAAIGPSGFMANAQEITPHDTNELPVVPLAIFSATTGTARVTFQNDVTINLQLEAGIPYAYRIKRIHQTGTTASGFVILW